jgi:hypothetical protein
MLSRPESVGERAVGEDDAENSWRNSFTITEYLYVWALLRSRVKGWNMTRSLGYDSSYGINGDHCNLRSAALIAFDILGNC